MRRKGYLHPCPCFLTPLIGIAPLKLDTGSGGLISPVSFFYLPVDAYIFLIFPP